MTILLINSSIRGDDSVSRTLSNKLAEQLSQSHGDHVLVRNLPEDLHFVSEQSFAAVQVPKDERSEQEEQLASLADTLIDELIQADTIVIGAPIYNFGPPAALKAWADLVARAGTTFKYTETGPVGLLEGKKAYIAAVSGGTPVGGPMDFMSGWLQFFLGFLGIKDVELIIADGMMSGDGPKKIELAHQKIESIAQQHGHTEPTVAQA